MSQHSLPTDALQALHEALQRRMRKDLPREIQISNLAAHPVVNEQAPW